jgi:hypothetical protein
LDSGSDHGKSYHIVQTKIHKQNPYLEKDSNPQFHDSSGPRSWTPKITRKLGLVLKVILPYINYEGDLNNVELSRCLYYTQDN